MSSSFKLVIFSGLAVLVLLFRFFFFFNQLAPEVGKEIKLVEKVSSEPVIYGQSQFFSLGEYRIRAKILPQYHYGDLLEIYGKTNKNLLIPFPEIRKIGQDKDLISKILTFRRFLLLKAAQIWPEPQSSLLTGIILGQDTIPAKTREILINTGTIHIVVVSGQNLAIFAGFLTSTLSRFLRQRLTLVLVILGIIFYTILTGFQPATIRAAIMAILTFFAKFAGRENWGFLALALTGFLLLLFKPDLILDISFQLSFAATFGILFAQNLFEAIFKNLPKFIKESLSVTLAAWIFTAPIIAFYFSKFTPITPISNLLIIPFVPFLMILAGFSLLLASVNLFLGFILALPSYTTASYFLFVTQNLVKIPAATLSFSQVNIFLVFSSYVFIVLTILWSKRKFLAKN